MSDWEAGDIINEATRDIPEAIMDNQEVQGALQYLFDTVATLTDWIDPDSDGYREDLYDAERRGAEAVVERYQSMLADAVYRQQLFGEQFDLERFVDTLSTTPIHEVLEEAR